MDHAKIYTPRQRFEILGLAGDQVPLRQGTLLFERTNGMSRGTPNFYPEKRSRTFRLLIHKVSVKTPKTKTVRSTLLFISKLISKSM